ncbi:MAG: hypothetical protein L0Y58_01735 [Verrucomicrobia subdivision 3 bacterium]|nr:hypothetical protein [Limisphaerales bacterium]
MLARRSFLRLTGGAGALAALGDFGFLGHLPSVSAAEAEVRPVRLHPDIEPLVRLLEDTPRERVLEEVAARVRRGLAYRDVLAALLLAGVRNIQPRPVGFKFHAVLVVNSAHLASLASPDSDRWLPIFWAIDQFKSSQAADVREGNWTMAPVDEKAVPPPDKARQAFINAMERWDEAAADVAVAGLARSASAHDLFDLFARYGMRDFREIGHKAIYVANSFRTLEVIGRRHAEPILRSLAYALLDTDKQGNPAKADLPADRPFRKNVPAAKTIRADWLNGKLDSDATAEMLRTVREGAAVDASTKALELLNKGVAPQSIYDALFDGAGELLMRTPGILSLHAITFTNAMHYAFRHCAHDETRRLLLLQNAAFLPLFRRQQETKGVRIDELEPAALKSSGEEAVNEIFSDIGVDTAAAARKVLAYLENKGDVRLLADTARRLIFLKGNNSHDYKFSSAVLEDYEHLAPPWRDRFLAASVFNLRGAGANDTDLVKRIRSALSA